MINTNDLLAQFFGTWNILLDRQLPALIQKPDEEIEVYGPDNPPPLFRMMAPLVGCVPGIALYLPVWMVYHVFGVTPAVIAGALGGAFLLEYLTCWKGLNALVNYMRLRRAGVPQGEALQREPEDLEERPLPPVATIMVMMIYLLRVMMIGALTAFDAVYWVIAALCAAYLVRGELTALPQTGTSEPLVPTPHKYANRGWIAAAAALIGIAVIDHCMFVPASLLGLGAAWCMIRYFSGISMKHMGGITQQAIEVFGYAAEIVLLLLGVLMFTGVKP